MSAVMRSPKSGNKGGAMLEKALRDESGFLFAEILVSMAIFATLTLVAWKGINAVIKVQEINRQRNTALAVATQFIDEEKARYLMEGYDKNIDNTARVTEYEDGHGTVYEVRTVYSKHGNTREEDYHNQLVNIHVRVVYPLNVPENQRHNLDYSTLVNYRTSLFVET
jgi:type II secretory pathway pseudopilin PulG